MLARISTQARTRGMLLQNSRTKKGADLAPQATGAKRPPAGPSANRRTRFAYLCRCRVKVKKNRNREGEAMANREQVQRLWRGVSEWNRWRDENPDIQPDLSGAHLCQANLYNAHLYNAVLS